MKIGQIRDMTKDELLHNRKLIMEEWFNLRMQRALKPLDDPHRIRNLRRDLAKINTLLREQELGIDRQVKPREKKLK